MADGWLWLSMRMATAIPSPASMTPAFSPGPTSTWGASVGSRLQVDPRRLVRAVLAPHHREQGQLEMVGGTPQDGLHLVALPVGEAEGPVEGLVHRSTRAPARHLHLRPWP